MKTENEVRTVTTIRLDTEDKQALDSTLSLLTSINREMCGMHTTEIEILFDNGNTFDEEFDKCIWDAEELLGLIQALSKIQNCIGIQIEGDYYEGMS